MEIIIAPKSGFCFGVKRAVDMAEKSATEKKVYSLGPLIHNPRETKRLADKIVVAEALADVDFADEQMKPLVVVRSHGVGPNVYEEAKYAGIEIVDATCPFVKTVQKAAHDLDKEGYQVVIVGDHDHPEVMGIKSWTSERAWIVANAEEAKEVIAEKALQATQKVAVVAQTTQKKANFDEVCLVLNEKFEVVECKNTICKATKMRQEAAEILAKKVDLMVVVGGKNSANTKKLLQICQGSLVKAILIEGADELTMDLFDGVKAVGVCAGASTPDWIIEEVVEKMTEVNEVMENQVEEVAVEAAPEKRNFAEEMSFAQAEVEAPAVADENEEESFADFFAREMKDIRRGSKITGVIVQIRPNEMLVDIGGKSEGLLPSNQLMADEAERIMEIFKVGDEIDVVVLKKENKEGYPVLSKRMVDQVNIWEKLAVAKDEETPVTGKVVEIVKGGLLMDVGVRGFVPASLVDTKFVDDLKVYIGKELTAKVLECDRSKNKLLLSPKAIKLVEAQKAKEAVWATIVEGETIKGTVSRLTSFGAFVDLGGVDGLLHVSEMAWFRVNHPSDVLQEGDEIEAFVLVADKENQKISLGLKQLVANPWELVGEKYPEGSIVEAKVMRTAPFGAFVQLEPGVEGLVHISHLSREHVAKTEDVVAPGQIVDVKVLSIDTEAKRLSLSIRETLPEMEYVEEYMDEMPADAE